MISRWPEVCSKSATVSFNTDCIAAADSSLISAASARAPSSDRSSAAAAMRVVLWMTRATSRKRLHRRSKQVVPGMVSSHAVAEREVPGDVTFRQGTSARRRAKCSAWAKCLG